MKSIGSLLNTVNDSWNKVMSDYNISTYPLTASFTGADNNMRENDLNLNKNTDYNMTFETLADNLTAEVPKV